MVRNVKRLSAATAAIAAIATLFVATAAPDAVAAAETAVKDRGVMVDVNAASAPDLEKVPGIGPALAKRIVEFREKNGPFQSLDDLLKVQGIGEKSLAKFREYLSASRTQKK